MTLSRALRPALLVALAGACGRLSPTQPEEATLTGEYQATAVDGSPLPYVLGSLVTPGRSVQFRARARRIVFLTDSTARYFLAIDSALVEAPNQVTTIVGWRACIFAARVTHLKGAITLDFPSDFQLGSTYFPAHDSMGVTTQRLVEHASDGHAYTYSKSALSTDICDFTY